MVEINFSDLPDAFIVTIENLIKKERPEIVILDDEDKQSLDKGKKKFII
jgi:hypothetical protein